MNATARAAVTIAVFLAIIAVLYLLIVAGEKALRWLAGLAARLLDRRDGDGQ